MAKFFTIILGVIESGVIISKSLLVHEKRFGTLKTVLVLSAPQLFLVMGDNGKSIQLTMK